MIIKSLRLIHFGKFHEKELDLQPGINVVYGPNEAGKSTIYYFIKCMLFGVARSRGKGAANDEYTRFFPWEGGFGYEGILVFEHEGRSYRLYRNFYKENPAFKVFDDDTGEEIFLKTGHIEDVIPGLNESDFLNTLSIAQGQSRMNDAFAASLQSYFANMAMTKDENIDISKAEAYLLGEEKRIRSMMPKDQLELLKKELTFLEQNKAEETSKIERDILEEEQHLSHQLKLYKNKIEDTKQREHKERAEGLSLLEQLRQLLVHLKSEEEAAEQRGKRMPIMSQGAFRLFLLCTVIGIALIALQMALQLDVFLMKILTGLFFGGAFVCLAKTSFKRPVDDIDLNYYKKEIEGIKEKLTPYQKKYGQKMNESPYLDHLEAQYEQLRKRYEGVYIKREKLLWEQEQRYKQQEKSNQVKQLYEEALAQNKALKTELEALALSKMVIKQLAAEIQKDFGSKMNEQVIDVFSEITGQEDKRIILDEHLNIHIDGAKQQIPIQRLSTGTIDQLYFSLRFCAADVIFGEKEIPVIIDDCFAYYDDERLKRMLSWLGKQKKHQIILFTCHQRELEELNRLAIPYQYIGLSTELSTIY